MPTSLLQHWGPLAELLEHTRGSANTSERVGASTEPSPRAAGSLSEHEEHNCSV